MKASTPAVTATVAATSIGLAPRAAILLKLTFEPTPAKAIANVNGSTVPEMYFHVEEGAYECPNCKRHREEGDDEILLAADPLFAS